MTLNSAGRLLFLVAAVLWTRSLSVAEVPLIPRELLFGNPDRANAQLSPDGKWISFLAPQDGVMNIWISPSGDVRKARPLTADRGRGIREYRWAYDNQRIVYLQDRNGDENDHAYCVNVSTRDVLDLTPITGVKAVISGLSPRRPNEIVVSLNDRDRRFHDLHIVNLRTGQRYLLFKNERFLGIKGDRFFGVMVDDDFTPRIGMSFRPDDELEISLSRDGKEFKPAFTVAPDDLMSTLPLGCDKSGAFAYFIDSRSRDKSALKKIEIATLREEVVAEGSLADISAAMFHPSEKTIQAYSVNYLTTEWKPIDPSVRNDFSTIRKISKGEFNVVSRSLDDRKWLVDFVQDDAPARTYLYDRGRRKGVFLFTNRSALEGWKLSKMVPLIIPARDGLELVSYLTLPAGLSMPSVIRRQLRLPLVLAVHGGPWMRNNWGFSSLHQWLANRGYAVLSVNYRGSTGFGKSFVNAANREWAGKMHDDLIDAVDWAISKGIAHPNKVAISGGSFGGYATLVGLTFTPDKFACGVDAFGPSNLVTMMENIPPYWIPLRPVLKHRVGDPSTRDGRLFLESRSPLSKVSSIRRPLLIGQGANDARVKRGESDQIVKSMKSQGLPVTYIVFSDEGHGFRRPENSLAFNGVVEAFLSRHLGGRAEPLGLALKGSSISVPEGAQDIPGLSKALETAR